MSEISVICFNTRGLRNRLKRRTVFRHLHITYPKHIVILEETHSTDDVETVWQSEWGASAIFSHGTVHQAGVAIFLPRSFSGTIYQKFNDDEGRVAGICFTIGNEKYMIAGIYAPAVDIQETKIAFFIKLRDILAQHAEINMICGGDYNTLMGPFDAESGKYKNSGASEGLRDLLEEFGLKDVWRCQNPTKREYTWRRLNPQQQSRIDYFFVSEAFSLNYETKAQITAGIRSDHSVVEMKALPAGRERGAGMWRYNNQLHLSDSAFVDAVKNKISSALIGEGQFNADVAIGVRVEMLLSEIRVICIRRSKAIAYETRKEEAELIMQVTEMEKELDKLTAEQNIQYRECRERLDDIKTRRGQQAIIASGASWLEHGEKVTSNYFLSRGRQLSAQKTITEINNNGEIITGDKAILQHCVSHFRDVYSSKGVDTPTMLRFLNNDVIPQLSDHERDKCEGPITDGECRFAISHMNKNKAPGVTGFTAEFFLHFWDNIGELIVEYINDAYANGFFVTQRRGIITLIPKKGDELLLENKRPICLLDIIYKITAKVIANRIGTVIGKLITTEQTGFIRGRFIGENLRLVSDVISYCETDGLQGIMIACDFRAAFDSLEHEYLFATLKAYNFGDSLIQWVRLLYSEAKLTIINNGYTSEWFNCNRGTFQGSPLSGMIFDLALETLAVNIRANRNIRGINISGVEVKLSLYADDVNAFVHDQSSAETLVGTIADFSQASGLSLNAGKSSVMWLGTQKARIEPVCGIEAVDKIKTLGIVFSATENCVNDNVGPVSKRIERVINMWSQRTLTIKGKITVSKSLLSSQLVFLSSCIQIPKKNKIEIQSKIMRFLWRGRPPKVARKTLYQGIQNGGLKAVNIELLCSSLQMAWIRRMHTCRDSIWRKILQARIGKYELSDMIRTCLGYDEIKKLRIPSFYKEILTEFQQYTSQPLDCAANIQKEMLWYNRSIRSGGKTMFVNGLYRAGIKFVDDITKHNGSIMNLNELKDRFPQARTDFLTYHTLVRKIPELWKRTLESGTYQKLSETQKNEAFSIAISGKQRKIMELRSSHFYNDRLDCATPTAVKRWENIGYNIDSWEHVFKIPYQCTVSTRLQSLQYRVLHRYLPTKRYLCIRNVIDSPYCTRCDRMDTIEHCLYECLDVKGIWDKVFQKLCITSENPVHSVVFGIRGGKHAINLIILLMKQYVVQCKLSYNTATPTYDGIKGYINHHVSLEWRIALGNGSQEKFKEKWQNTLDETGKIKL